MASLAACANLPQSRGEFKTLAADHPKWYMASSYTASRRLEDVAATLQRRWDECFSVKRTTTRTQGGMTTMNYTESWHPRVKKVSNSLIELTLQETTQGMIMLNKIPEGGEYRVALDLERLPGNKTKLSWYSPDYAGWRAQWERNKKWSDGKDVACDAE
jgi:hypothetical protein